MENIEKIPESIKDLQKYIDKINIKAQHKLDDSYSIL